MTYTSVFGSLLGRDQLERAILGLFQAPPTGGTQPLIVYYLAELERQQGLPARTLPPPPGADSYRGGLDFETWQEDWTPALIVACQPAGAAERYEAGKYTQEYEIQAAAIVAAEDEDSARILADRYGIAVAALLAQPTGLGNVPNVDKAVLTSLPRTEFLDDNPPRRLARSVSVFHAIVENVVSEQGPTSFGSDPYQTPRDWPAVTQVEVQLQSQTPAGAISPATGATVTTPVGGGDVVVTE